MITCWLTTCVMLPLPCRNFPMWLSGLACLLPYPPAMPPTPTSVHLQALAAAEAAGVKESPLVVALR